MATRSAGPGPGAYTLQSLVGYEKHDASKRRMPQYSFGMKSKLKPMTIGPGPGAYSLQEVTRYGAKSSPAFTIASRVQMKSKDIGPGPGAYSIQSLKNFRGPSSPAYTIGIKTKPLKQATYPGPNEYSVNVNSIKPGCPAFSIGLKTKLLDNKNRSPGPAAYGASQNCTWYRCPPAYTMAGRREGVKSKGLQPGPNQYDLQTYRPGRRGPEFSFGVKHSPFTRPLVLPCDN